MIKLLKITSILLLLPLSIVPAVGAERIFVYPAQGQSEQQQSADRFHCHKWAVNNTGFDPLDARHGSAPTYVAIPLPQNDKRGATGKGMVGGAVAGALIGEIDSNRPGRGAALGAVLGALLGGTIEHRGQQQARMEARQQAEQVREDRRELAIARSNYRRALTACMEGHGYRVN